MAVAVNRENIPMNEELRECPLCGGEVSIALSGNGDEQWYFITRGSGKNKCDCRLFMESEKFHRDDGKETKMKAKNDLINRWNKRVFIIRR